MLKKNGQKFYIQSAYTILNDKKKEQEIRGFKKIKDTFKKIVIVKDNTLAWYDNNGILYIGLEKFLLDEESLSK